VSRNAILARIKLASNDSVLAEWSANGLANLTDCAVGVELLSDRAGGGDDRGVLVGLATCYVEAMEARTECRHTCCGIAFVPLFAPSLSAALVVLSVIFVFWVFGAWVLLRPGIWSERGPVDLGI